MMSSPDASSSIILEIYVGNGNMAPAMVVGVAVYMALTVAVMVLVLLVTVDSVIFASRVSPLSILVLI